MKLPILLSKLEGYISSGFLFYLLLIAAIILVGFKNFKRLALPYKLLVVLVSLTFLSEVISSLLEGHIGTNYPFYHVLQWIEFVFYGAIYHLLLKAWPRTKRFITTTAIVFGLITVCITFFYQNLYSFPSIGSSLLSLFIVMATLLLLARMVQSPIDIPIYHQPVFWFGIGSLFFHTITFFVFGYFKFLSFNTEVPGWGYSIIRFSNFILYGCYFICIFYAARTSKTHS